jgi:regulator of sigma E protease
MSIIIFIIVLVALILVHEFGHFIVAKKSGIRVDEFGFGFPPRAWRFWKKGETEYTLNWIPFGGFVKIFGENPDEESLRGPDSDRSFVNKSKWTQAAVLIAGVFFNIIFAWFLFFIVFVIGSPATISEDEIENARDIRLLIAEVVPNSPASLAGLEAGDEILGITSGNTALERLIPSEVSSFIEKHGERELTMSLKRGVDNIELTSTPQAGVIVEEPERAVLGISMGLVGLVSYPLPTALWKSIIFTIEITGLIAVSLFSFFASAFTLTADLSQVAGPVGIVGLVGEASTLGFVFLLNFTAFISINLAIINLLPFPALDGGRLFFLLIETIKGSPIQPRVANTANTIGFTLLILLMLLITYSDIARIVSG